ncbi:hypothetical protein EMCRGX_G028847 [Ephydatia muelleri]
MGRQLTLEQLKAEWPYLHRFQEQDQEFKSHQKANFDNRHRVHTLPEIPDQTEVWITIDRSKPTLGVVASKAELGSSGIHCGDEGDSPASICLHYERDTYPTSFETNFSCSPTAAEAPETETVTSLVSKCQLGVICLWLDQYHNLAPKEGKSGHDGKGQQYNHVCSCVMSPHPQHSDKLKHGVPGGQAG